MRSRTAPEQLAPELEQLQERDRAKERETQRLKTELEMLREDRADDDDDDGEEDGGAGGVVSASGDSSGGESDSDLSDSDDTSDSASSRPSDKAI
jgi:hypothetical protein